MDPQLKSPPTLWMNLQREHRTLLSRSWNRHHRVVALRLNLNFMIALCTWFMLWQFLATQSHSLYRKRDVSPKILVDLESHSNCRFETFLDAFLALCLDGKPTPPKLLDRCLHAVLPICNAHLNPNKGTKRTKGKDYDYGADIHGHLTT